MIFMKIVVATMLQKTFSLDCTCPKNILIGPGPLSKKNSKIERYSIGWQPVVMQCDVISFHSNRKKPHFLIFTTYLGKEPEPIKTYLWLNAA